MKKNIHLVSVVFLATIGVIVLYWAFKGVFYLMSQRSTVENISGFVGLVFLLFVIIATIVTVIKNLKIK